jgi:hypothetical protein
MKIYLFCSFNSSGVVELSKAIKAKGIDCLRIKENHGQSFSHGPMFNWGCGDGSCPPVAKIVSGKLYNSAKAVLTSCSKTDTHKSLLESQVWTVAMTKERNRAMSWLGEDRTVLARKNYGSNGDGISVIKPGEALPYADFYSRLFPSTHEFRVHVAFGKVIDIALKVKRDSDTWAAEGKNYNEVVRSFDGGWRLSHDFKWADVLLTLGNTTSRINDILKEMGDLGAAAIKAVGLDFGAVDMLANLDPNYGGQRFVVCETNSAPAMELDKTLEAYTMAFIAKAKADVPQFSDNQFEV